METTSKNIVIFTDGSSRGNPGRGGWGTVIVNGTHVTELGGAEKHTTNNRMEIMAALHGIAHTPAHSTSTVHTDSSYLINSITKWIKGWKRNGWKTQTKDDVSNKDLWVDLDAALSNRTVNWQYVGGHVGIVGNERCDEIATAMADGDEIKLYDGSLSGYGLQNILDISLDQAKSASKKSDSSRSRAKAFSYISSVAGKVQVHQTWAECEKRVKGVGRVRFKKALDKAEELKIISEFS